MPNSTTAAPSRLLLAPSKRSSSHRYGGDLGSLSSAAGFQQRPWLARLRRALRDQHFILHYQPIVSLASGEISHHEALVRLADEPDGTLIAPGRFLPAAERYALIQQIDRLVLAKALTLLAETRFRPRVSFDSISPTQRDGEVRVAVNLSALSITDPGMLDHIEGELSRRRLDPSKLIVEITETAAISDMTRAKDFCWRLQSLGVKVALDDFGAGFGSFQYLKHLPFDYLKIDGDFIQNLTASREDQLVVKALVGVAAGMGKETIAEFVGDEETVELLREYGVDYAQGFQIGRPSGALEAFAYAA
jgi:EAL domain-containing protein (putative c-di-GMP-specific phosphodiesterase class I)